MDDLDPEALALLRGRARDQIRKRSRALRSATPPGARAARSTKLVERIAGSAEFARATNLASYWPMADRGEADLRELDRIARNAGKRVFYPSAVADRLGFRATEGDEDLIARGRPFPEPDPDAQEPESLDLVIVPALAADGSGNRLGYGSGFYDRVLPRFCPPAVAAIAVYEFQMFADIPTEQHDVRCGIVFTDETVHRVLAD